MTAADPILSLRPTDGSSGAIAAAIERARSALVDAEASVTATRQARDAALLDADAKTLAGLERKLTDARTAAAEASERIGAVLRQLEARLATTKHAEALADLAGARHASEAAGSALAAWWAENAPKLAAVLAEGVRLDEAWDAASRNWHRTASATTTAYPDTAPTAPANTGQATFEWRDDVKRMADPIRPPIPRPAPDPANVEREAAREATRAKATADYHDRGGTISPARPRLEVAR